MGDECRLSSPFYEVRLLVGPHLVARAEINQSRPDVCEELGLQTNPGFVLPVPVDLPPLDWTLPVRVVAVGADGTAQEELSLMQTKVNTANCLRELLKSDQRGMDGHVDGIHQGDLLGWAHRPGQQQSATIWLQSEGLDPLSVDCSQWRDGMTNKQMPHYCGFAMSLESLPASWAGQSIWCSFDQSGQWRLPQEEELFVPAPVEDGAVSFAYPHSEQTVVSSTSYSSQVSTAPEELQEHWRALEDFRLFLDDLEQELNRRDHIKAQQKYLKPQHVGWFGRLLRPLR